MTDLEATTATQGTETKNNIRYEKGSHELVILWWDVEIGKDIFVDFWKTWFSQLNVRLVPAENVVKVNDEIDNATKQRAGTTTTTTTTPTTTTATATTENMVNFNHFDDWTVQSYLKYERTNILKCPQIVFASENCRMFGGSMVEYVAVLDSQTYISSSSPQMTKQHRRAFIGQQIASRGRNHVVGGICYFNEENGTMDGPMVILAGGSLFDCDERDLQPNWKNVFLCGNTLCYIWKSKDGHSVELKICQLQEEKLVRKLGIELDNDNGKDADVRDSVVVCNRWLCLKCYYSTDQSEYFCIDLTSFRTTNEESTGLAYDRVFIPPNMDLAPVLGSLDGVPSYDFSTRKGGYPSRCIKCSEPTVEGWIQPGNSPLGSGACGSQCRIRYSARRKKWLCWDVVFDSKRQRLVECDTVLCHSHNYICPNTKNHSSNHVTVWVREERHKKPHRGPGGSYLCVDFFCRLPGTDSK